MFEKLTINKRADSPDRLRYVDSYLSVCLRERFRNDSQYDRTDKHGKSKKMHLLHPPLMRDNPSERLDLSTGTWYTVRKPGRYPTAKCMGIIFDPLPGVNANGLSRWSAHLDDGVFRNVRQDKGLSAELVECWLVLIGIDIKHRNLAQEPFAGVSGEVQRRER